MHKNSLSLFSQAQRYIPGGVNSPVRAFKSVSGTPPFIKQAKGAYLIDEDDQRYVDYVGSWGPMILGHAHPAVVKAVQLAAENGLSFGACTAAEIKLAQLICQLMPSIEMVRLVNSGTEATMSAIRLARGFTKRDKIIKFAGCYHGHSDTLLVNAGSGGLTFGVPSSAGVPVDIAKHTLTATFNDLTSVEKLFQQFPHEIACIIVEPVAGNMNCILPSSGFLAGLRELCNHYQALLIFDEVMTGFRVSLGGAQEYFNVKPDLTTLGKIIGGGCPVGAFGGRAEIMQRISPLGDVYQAGTLSGNPLAVAAGLATLQELTVPDFYTKLNKIAHKMLMGLQERAHAKHIPFLVQHVGSMFGLFFTPASVVNNLEDVKACDSAQFNRFFHGMLENGIYLAPSAYEAGFISAAHGDEELALTWQAAEKVFAELH